MNLIINFDGPLGRLRADRSHNLLRGLAARGRWRQPHPDVRRAEGREGLAPRVPAGTPRCRRQVRYELIVVFG